MFSMASGGAIFVRDPKKTLVAEQLNGRIYMPLTEKNWSESECMLTAHNLPSILTQECLMKQSEKRLNCFQGQAWTANVNDKPKNAVSGSKTIPEGGSNIIP